MCLLNSMYKKKKETLMKFDSTKKNCLRAWHLCSCGISLFFKTLTLAFITWWKHKFFYYLGYNFATLRLRTVQAGSLTVPRKFFDRGKRAPLVSVIIIKES